MKRSPKMKTYIIYEGFMTRSMSKTNNGYSGYIFFSNMFYTMKDYYNHSKAFIDRINNKIKSIGK